MVKLPKDKRIFNPRDLLNARSWFRIFPENVTDQISRIFNILIIYIAL